MDEVLKCMIGDQKKLQEMLECSRTQAWRIWTGRSQLTKINERYLWKLLSNEA